MILTYSDDYSDFEYEIDKGELLEYFLQTLTAEEAEELVKEWEFDKDEEGNEMDLHDALENLVDCCADELVDSYYDDLKDYFEEQAMEQREYDSDTAHYLGVSHWW